jgi:hypothetical protein
MKYRPDYEDQFTTLAEFESGGIIKIHKAVSCDTNDFTENFYVAIVKALAGSRVDLMPVLPGNDWRRSIIYLRCKA